jgi:hypothetical protein
MYSNRLALAGHLLVALLAILTFGGVVAAAAHAEEAPHWTIAGSSVAQGETHYIAAKAYNEIQLESPSLGIKIKCPVIKLKEGVLLGSTPGEPGTINQVIEFEGGCTQTGNGASCKVVEPIVTIHVKSELVYNVEGGTQGKKLLLEYFPETGARFTTIKFTGTCTTKESAVEGSIAGEVRTDPNKPPELGGAIETGEAKSWLINFPTTPAKEVWLIKGGVGKAVKTELKVATEPAVFSGTALVSLANQKHEAEEVNWGFAKAAPLFRMTSNWNGMLLRENQIVELKVKNESGVKETPSAILLTLTPVDWEILDPNNCETKQYEINETCAFTAKYLHETADELRAVVEDKNGGRSGVRIKGK